MGGAPERPRVPSGGLAEWFSQVGSLVTMPRATVVADATGRGLGGGET